MPRFKIKLKAIHAGVNTQSAKVYVEMNEINSERFERYLNSNGVPRKGKCISMRNKEGQEVTVNWLIKRENYR
jgi:hypothetical protein